MILTPDMKGGGGWVVPSASEVFPLAMPLPFSDQHTKKHTVLETDQDIIKYFGAEVSARPTPAVRKRKRATAKLHVLIPLKDAGVVRPGTTKSRQRSCKVCRRKKSATHYCFGCGVRATICSPACLQKHIALHFR